MRDEGLDEAIRAAGGVTELARRIGISQPSISGWNSVPADRVLAVEAATGIARVQLRPDLYREPRAVDDIDKARAREYALLAVLLTRAPDMEMLNKLSSLRGDTSPLGVVHAALAQTAAAADPGRVSREFFDLFIGLGRGELLPYASYYLTGFLNERPLARLREDLARLGIERVEGNYEPEDHAAILCEIMAGMIAGSLPASGNAEREIFNKHMAPWVRRFFADLERAESAMFYRGVGALGRVLMDIEMEAFALPD